MYGFHLWAAPATGSADGRRSSPGQWLREEELSSSLADLAQALFGLPAPSFPIRCRSFLLFDPLSPRTGPKKHDREQSVVEASDVARTDELGRKLGLELNMDGHRSPIALQERKG